jgi:sialidase-1
MFRREAIVAIAAAVAPAAPGRITEDLFIADEGGYRSYRIPSLIATRQRNLLAFCEGRKNGTGDTGDIDLMLRRSGDGGHTWSPQKVLFDFSRDVIGNPCPVQDRNTGVIWLLLTSNPGDVTEKQIMAGEDGAVRTVWLSSSKDEGLSWSPPVNITAQTKRRDWGWYATGPGIGIQLSSGRLVIPCDHSRIEGGIYGSHVIYSDDHGSHWKIGGAVTEGANECQVVQLSDGSLLLNMRMQSGEKKRGLARSTDGGFSWGPLSFDHKLIDPVCQGSLVSDGAQLLFSNPASVAKREKLTVRMSSDMGRTWPRELLLAPGPAAYSCLAVLGRQRYACLFETGERGAYERIRFNTFSASDLMVA